MQHPGRRSRPNPGPPPPAGPTPPSSGSSTPSSPSSTSSARGTSGSSSRSCWRCWGCSCWPSSSTASLATWSRNSWGHEGPMAHPQLLSWAASAPPLAWTCGSAWSLRGLVSTPGASSPRSLPPACRAGDSPPPVLTTPRLLLAQARPSGPCLWGGECGKGCLPHLAEAPPFFRPRLQRKPPQNLPRPSKD